MRQVLTSALRALVQDHILPKMRQRDREEGVTYQFVEMLSKEERHFAQWSQARPIRNVKRPRTQAEKCALRPYLPVLDSCCPSAVGPGCRPAVYRRIVVAVNVGVRPASKALWTARVFADAVERVVVIVSHAALVRRAEKEERERKRAARKDELLASGVPRVRIGEILFQEFPKVPFGAEAAGAAAAAAKVAAASAGAVVGGGEDAGVAGEGAGAGESAAGAPAEAAAEAGAGAASVEVDAGAGGGAGAGPAPAGSGQAT